MASGPSGSDLEEYVLILLGAARSGKSMAGNFIAGEEVFPTALIELSGKTAQHKFEYKGMSLRLIDTVGFDEGFEFPDYLLTELTKAVLMAADAGGIHAFLICAKVGHLFDYDVIKSLDDLNFMKPIFAHAMLLVTYAGKYGETEDQRKQLEVHILNSRVCPPCLTYLVRKVAGPRILLEYFDLDHTGARERKFDEIMQWVKMFVAARGVYNNDMMQKAKQLWEEYKLEVQEKAIHKTGSHEPSYSELAFQIVQSVDIFHMYQGRNPFSVISHGIEEFRRKRQAAYSAEQQVPPDSAP